MTVPRLFCSNDKKFPGSYSLILLALRRIESVGKHYYTLQGCFDIVDLYHVRTSCLY
jgi:hypothetical protein